MLYSDKLVGNPTWTFVYAASSFCFTYSLGHLGNLLTTSLFFHNCRAFVTKLNLVTKKKVLLKTFLDLISHLLQLLSLCLV